MLTPPQKQQRIACPGEFLSLCSNDTDGVLGWIVTGDKTWVHHYESELMQDFMQWHKKGSAPSKKFKVSQSAGKIMATVFLAYRGNLTQRLQGKGCFHYGWMLRYNPEAFAGVHQRKTKGKISQKCPAPPRQRTRTQVLSCTGCLARDGL